MLCGRGVSSDNANSKWFWRDGNYFSGNSDTTHLEPMAYQVKADPPEGSATA